MEAFAIYSQVLFVLVVTAGKLLLGGLLLALGCSGLWSVLTGR